MQKITISIENYDARVLSNTLAGAMTFLRAIHMDNGIMNHLEHLKHLIDQELLKQ